MKAKIMNRGAGFRGVLDYAYKSTAVVIGGNMSGTNARDLATEFGVARQMRPDVDKPVWHCSLSLPAGEKISDEKWLKIADKFMKDMEFTSLNQYHVVKHEDTDKQHIHIIANRVGLDGSLWYGKREALKAIDITQKLEKEFALVATVGLENKNGKKSLTKGEIEMSLRTGDAPAKQILQNTIDTALGSKGNKQSIFAFMERLEKADIKVIPNVAKTGKMNGFSFECGGVYFKGSQLGKKYSWNELIKRGVTYEQDREGEKLIERAEQAKATSSIESSGIATVEQQGITQNNKPTQQHGANVHGHGLEYGGVEQERGIGAANGVTNKPNSSAGYRQNIQQNNGGVGRSESGNVDDKKVELENVSSVLDAGNDTWRDASSSVADLNAASASSVLKPDHQAKVRAWAAQHEALHAEQYRITCFPRVGERKPFVVGKQKDAPEITYFYHEVEEKIPELRAKNAQGFDIYITPIDTKHHFILIDDIKTKDLEAIKKDYSPCLIQSSSHDNYQAVLKIEKPKHKDKGEQSIANKIMIEINTKYGDPKITAVVHGFRMAGFSNKKTGRDNFITRVVQNMKGFVTHCFDDLMNAMRAAAPEVKEKKKKTEFEQVLDDPVVVSGPEVKRAFDRSYSKYVGLAETNGWTKDDSKIDFNVAKDLLKQRFSADTVGQALKDFSPDLSRRHKDVDSYVEKTIESAKRGMNNGYKI